MILTIIVFLVITALLIHGKVNIGIVGILGASLLQLTGVLTQAEAWSGFSNTTIIMFASFFIMGAGLGKSNFIDIVRKRLIRYRGNQKVVLFVFAIAGWLLAVITNSTAAVATLIPIIIVITQDLNVSTSRTLKPVTDIANMWSGALPIGSGAALYLTCNQVLENLGSPVRFGFFDIFIAKGPILIAASLFTLLIGYKFFPESTGISSENIDLNQTSDSCTLSKTKNIICYIVYILTIIFVVLSSTVSWFKVPNYLIACIGALVFYFAGILDAKEFMSAMNLPALCLIAGLLPIATAFNKTGAGDLVASAVQTVLGGSDNAYLVAGVFFLVPVILTQFMNNVVVINLFMAISGSVAVSLGINPVPCMIAPVIAGTISLLTPMASAPQMMVFGPGKYKMTDYLKGSIGTVIVGFISYMIWVPLIFKF